MTSAEPCAAAARSENQSAGDRWEDQAVGVVFPALLQGCWEARRASDGLPDEAPLEQTYGEASALLFRLLLAFFADARGKLPPEASDRLRQWRVELAEQGGDVRGESAARFRAALGGNGREFLERLQAFWAPLDRIFSFPGALPFRSLTRHPLDAWRLAAIVDGLSRIGSSESGTPEFVDYSRLPVRRLGSIYERLLEFRLEANTAPAHGSLRSRSDPARRKQGGCFYTPEPIIAHILEQTVGPALETKLAALAAEFPLTLGASCGTAGLAPQLLDRLFEFRVLDPAMGTGHFLLAAADFIAERVAEFLRGAGCAEAFDVDALKQLAIERSLFGIDLDPRAVQLAQLSLWLEAPLDHGSLEPLERNLRCGDALRQTEWENFARLGEFDAVIGNPPYGAKLEPAARRALAQSLPLMKSNADTAAGFIERAAQWIRPEGRVGLIVPKPLTYSYVWRDVRRFLRGRLEHLVDVSRAWSEVRLEQAIIVFRGGETADYQTAWSEGGRIVPGARMSWALADRFETLPCALEADERRRLAALQFSDATIGNVCRTFRGLPAQRSLDDGVGPPVIGGRDLERWRMRGASGRLRADARFSLDAFRCEKLVFQNIIAHVARPQPHVLLIGAYDDRQTVTLDTVNNLAATDSRVNLLGLLGLLHSELVNWLVYGVIYNKAIRTMHFDQYFLDKIPLPADWPALLERLAGEAEICTAATAGLAELARRAAEALQTGEGKPADSAALAALLGAKTRRRRTATHHCTSDAWRQIASGEEFRALQAEALRLAENRRRAHERIDVMVSSAYGDAASEGFSAGSSCNAAISG